VSGGSDDVRVPVEQGQQLYMILKKSGVTVEFVRYPREGHGLREPNHRRDRMERTLAWFERFLGPKAGTSED
jgi:dipeptidyl aminopeptidase/acylaminoacyl peptidase